jgi:dihydrofolate reductase
VSKVRFSLAMSLDGYVAGTEQSVENPLGVGGMRLHDWAFPLAAFRREHGLEGGEVNASTPVVEENVANVGAYVMGRNMFGGGTGPWPEEPWTGWWGDDPPYHTPVFVLTHHAREPLVMQGGTTFEFVTNGVEAALGQATAAAGGKDVVIAGGASVVRQALGAGLVDEVNVSLVPLLLGGGERLFDNLGDATPELEQIRAVDAPGVTHLKYRVLGPAAG